MTDHALHPSTFAPRAGSPFTQPMRYGLRLCRAWLAYRTRRALARLSDTMLRDVGLTRSDIDFVADALADARWPGEPR